MNWGLMARRALWVLAAAFVLWVAAPFVLLDEIAAPPRAGNDMWLWCEDDDDETDRA